MCDLSLGVLVIISFGFGLWSLLFGFVSFLFAISLLEVLSVFSSRVDVSLGVKGFIKVSKL